MLPFVANFTHRSSFPLHRPRKYSNLKKCPYQGSWIWCLSNSNSPELAAEGILLSTFPRLANESERLILTFPLQGRFDLFAHHCQSNLTPRFADALSRVILHNPAPSQSWWMCCRLRVISSQPEAPLLSCHPV